MDNVPRPGSFSIADIDVMFGDSPSLARLFSANPGLVFLLASSGAALVLFVPSFILGVASIPGGAVDRGFMHTSWPYTTGLMMPLILALMGVASGGICRRLARLVESRVVAAVGRDDIGPHGFLIDLEIEVTSRGRIINLATMLLVVTVSLIDLRDVVYGYAREWRGEPYAFREGDDWKSVFQERDWPTSGWNAAFVGVTYAWQGMLAFLGLNWLLRFCLLLHTLVVLVTPTSELEQRMRSYSIAEHAIFDPFRRLGLHPLGEILNLFFTMIVLFELYVIQHRLELVRLARGQTWTEHVALYFAILSRPALLAAPASYGLDGVDATMLFILLATAGGLVAAIVPLVRMHHYRRFFIAMAYDRYLRDSQAVDQPTASPPTASTLALQLARRLDPWPNGRTTALTFLAWVIGLALVAFLPPALVIVVPLLTLSMLVLFWATLIMGLGDV